MGLLERKLHRQQYKSCTGKSCTFKEFQEGDFQGVLKVRLLRSVKSETFK